jgi:hypothetical protein
MQTLLSWHSITENKGKKARYYYFTKRFFDQEDGTEQINSDAPVNNDPLLF